MSAEHLHPRRRAGILAGLSLAAREVRGDWDVAGAATGVDDDAVELLRAIDADAAEHALGLREGLLAGARHAVVNEGDRPAAAAAIHEYRLRLQVEFGGDR